MTALSVELQVEKQMRAYGVCTSYSTGRYRGFTRLSKEYRSCYTCGKVVHHVVVSAGAIQSILGLCAMCGREGIPSVIAEDVSSEVALCQE